LRNIRNDLHTSRDDTSRSATASSVGRSSRASETLGQLLNKGATDVVGSNVDGICNTKDNK
jgi:hypothetical protein